MAEETQPDPREDVKYASLGLECVLTFGLPLAGGVLLDLHLGWLPICTLIGGALGAAAALYRLIRHGWVLFQRGQSQLQQGPFAAQPPTDNQCSAPPTEQTDDADDDNAV
ncbi:MAG: hypothetical protein ACYS8X_14990 [Planctomycetota bacterium]|jgi:hypothetical protein